MKKIVSFLLISALFGFVFQPALAQGTRTTKAKTFDPACMVSAINKREDALLAAVDARYNTHKTALSARKSALAAGWALTETAARNTAVKKAWADYKTAATNAQNSFRTSKESAWKTFGTERRACKAPTVPGEPGTSSVDAKL